MAQRRSVITLEDMDAWTSRVSSVDPAVAAAEGAWVRGTRGEATGTVGSLIPGGYPAVARVSAPDPTADEWVDAYRHLFCLIACVGIDHTDVPTRAWFAMEERHELGLLVRRDLDAGSFPVGWSIDGESAPMSDRDLADELTPPAGATPATGSVLDTPSRRYRLLTGSVPSVVDLRGPGSARAWRHPDLYWPADRAWFVATDVEFWSLYVAGTEGFVAAVAARVPTSIELVEYGDRLVVED